MKKAKISPKLQMEVNDSKRFLIAFYFILGVYTVGRGV